MYVSDTRLKAVLPSQSIRIPIREMDPKERGENEKRSVMRSYAFRRGIAFMQIDRFTQAARRTRYGGSSSRIVTPLPVRPRDKIFHRD